jgi:hypothetical protein
MGIKTFYQSKLLTNVTNKQSLLISTNSHVLQQDDKMPLKNENFRFER